MAKTCKDILFVHVGTLLPRVTFRHLGNCEFAHTSETSNYSLRDRDRVDDVENTA